MKKRWIWAAAFGLTAISLAACKGRSGANIDSSDKRVFTYAENHAEDYPTTRGAYKFAELVYERTGGRIEIQVNAGGVLGDEKTVIEQMQYGGVDFARVSLSPLAEYVPKLNVLQMPYLYTGAEHMWRVLEGEIGTDFINSFEGSNLVALSWYDAGARNFYNSVRPITCLEDMKGLRIRVQESELMTELVEAFGADTSLMSFGEVYSGLQTGDVNGAENNWPSYESTNHYQVAKYYTVDEHTRVPEMQLCAQATWDSLSEADRQLIRECAQESAQYQRKLWAQREKTSEANVRAAGCEVVILSPAEKAKFQKAAAPIYEKFCTEYIDVIEAIIALGEEDGG